MSRPFVDLEDSQCAVCSNPYCHPGGAQGVGDRSVVEALDVPEREHSPRAWCQLVKTAHSRIEFIDLAERVAVIHHIIDER